ncbi:SRPBCC family protein [Streptomyces sp. NPDC058231]|uniref:SRPBCC family protein n=1 Tax=Streptomyces sp. NPDC058231 TaxID=3346392 RepID=UPI0036EE2CE1
MWLPGGTGDGLGVVEPVPHIQEDALSASISDHDPIGALDPSAFAFSRRAWVDATPAGVYDLISDVSAIARWSPDATEVTYDEGAGPQVGAWFSGRNQGRATVEQPLPGRTGRTRLLLRLRGRRRRGRHRPLDLDPAPVRARDRRRAVLATPPP